MTDLLAEFTDMAAEAADHADWLAEQGIGPRIVYRPGASIVGVCRAYLDDIWWQPDPNGRPVLVVPVSYETGPFELDPIDLIAWQPGKPGRSYRRTGDGPALGEDSVGYAMLTERPLVLHETPFDWVKANGKGACILDWHILPMELRMVDRFHCPSRRHALRLERALTEPIRQYDIRYPEVCRAA